MSLVLAQCDGADLKIGDIADRSVLEKNLESNCMPEGFDGMDAGDYEDFLQRRRVLMASKIREYYYSL